MHTSSEIKKSLRTTMRKVEQSVGSEADNPDVAELQHIVNRRIANLEEAEQADSPLTGPEEVV